MANNYVTVVYDRRKKEEKTGLGMVELCIYLSRKERKYISLGKASRSSWTDLASSKEVQENIVRYNNIVSAMVMLGMPMTVEAFCKQAQIEEKVGTTAKAASKPTLKTVKSEAAPSAPCEKVEVAAPSLLSVNKPAAAPTAIPIMQTVVEHEATADSVHRESEVTDFLADYIKNEDLKTGTKKGRMSFIRTLMEFGEFKTFADLTPSNLIKFNNWLHDGTRTDTTIYGNYHKKLSHYIRIMMMLDKVEHNPYDRVQFKRGKHETRHPLAEDDLITMRNLDLEGKLDRVRDLFVFSAYTSLAYADVMSFNFKHDVVLDDGQYYIDGKRTKTGTEFYTPILAPAMEVLKKYNYRLPTISNQKANDYLKLIQEKMGLRHKLTFHIARHSFATLAITYGVPIEVVAQMLGHKNVKTTQIYAKILKDTLKKQAVSFASHIKN